MFQEGSFDNAINTNNLLTNCINLKDVDIRHYSDAEVIENLELSM